MSDEPDLPEQPPASLIPRSAGGTPPPSRRATSRAPQNTANPNAPVSPTPWGTSAVPNTPPKRPSSPPQSTFVPPSRPPTPGPAPHAAAPTPGSVPATGTAGSNPATHSQAPFGGHASTRSKAPIPMPSSRPPFDVLMPAPKKPFSLPPYTVTLMKMVFFFAVMLMIAYSALVALNPKARKWATQKDGPTPFKSVNQMLAMPAQLVGKTKEVVASNDARVGTLDHVITDSKKTEPNLAKPLTDPFGKPAEVPGQSAARAAAAGKDEDDGRISREALLAMAEKDTQTPATPKTAPVRPAPTEAPAPAGPPELKLAGGIVITNRPAEGGAMASAPFMYWVAGLTVSGVSNTSPARFLMNGRLVREGDEVNKQLAITFSQVDAAAKQIYFRDKGGAVVTRSY